MAESKPPADEASPAEAQVQGVVSAEGELQRRVAELEVALAAAHADVTRLRAEVADGAQALRRQALRREMEHHQRLAADPGLEPLLAELESCRSARDNALAQASVAEQRRSILEAQVEELTFQLRSERREADGLARQVQDWRRKAVAESARAEQLQQLVWQLEARAREEADSLKTQLVRARAEADSAVSPGAALLLGLATAGLGAALAGSGSGRRRG